MWFRCKIISKKWTVYLLVIAIMMYFFYISIIQIINYILLNRLALLSYLKKPTTSSSNRLYKNKTNVIIGHYIGPGKYDKVSTEIENLNQYSPIAGEGENGRPVVIPAKDIIKMQRLFQINRFNLMASDRIPLNRTLPDVRKQRCQQKIYPTLNVLPNTTVIIVFHNEAWSVLLRTVWSVINRSPKELLEEIILVDDASERAFLRTELDEYVKKLPIKTRVLRLKKRKGLIAARLLGASHANGKVLTFLDAHCECSIGWLEPLLTVIHDNYRTIACPVIDIISDNNFGYIKSFELHWGAFNWQLHFRWYMLSERELQKRKLDITQPFDSPTMAGGLFSIDKHYFFEMGSYDSKMMIWGGDNLEISFRIWQCGGSIKIVPCSHVGHLFRKSSPYTFPGGINEILDENLSRTALVWMDDWSKFFFKFNNIPETFYSKLDISDRLELRKNLHCNDFEWYLENVWQEHFFPTPNRFFGKILVINTSSKEFLMYKKILLKQSSSNSNMDWINLINYLTLKTDKMENRFGINPMGFCLQKPQNHGTLNLPYGQATVKLCGNLTTISEMFIIKSNGQIMTNEGICLENSVNEENSIVKMVSCSNSERQKWIYNIKTQQISLKSTNLCLTASKNLYEILQTDDDDINQFDRNTKINLNINLCENNRMLQKWLLIPINWR